MAGKTGTNSDQKGVFFAGMTGYYSSALWVGHDNYKALASSSTGSSAAAPLWQAYMKKIHSGLENRDYLREIRQLDREFFAAGISPGGSADMLALTYFVDSLESLTQNESLPSSDAS